MYPYDPDKAVALLKEAGYDANNPAAFELLVNTDAPETPRLCIGPTDMSETLPVRTGLTCAIFQPFASGHKP